MSDVKKIKPSLSKGTRDFLPREVAKRNYIFDTIKSVFRKYGFEEIETPAIEKLETLTGKYGEEGDKLLFKILNSGDYLKDIAGDKFQNPNYKEWTNLIAEKGLRYDLTVPLARYAVMYQDKLAFPFKRFHIGPVWRADRPQKGRYQEFYQCDADVIGSTSLLNEVELTNIYLEVFEKLGVRVTVQINNRKILYFIAEFYDCANRFNDFTAIIDKLDKVGYSQVETELKQLGVAFEKTNVLPLGAFREGAEATGDWEGIRDWLRKYLHSEAEIELYNVVSHFEFGKQLRFNPFLARGLNYYTGTIWEVVANDVQIGSLGGGGRYDNLTEMFGGQNMSGVGISFGIERIYDVMEELNLFPETIAQGVKVLFVPRDETVEEFAFQQTQALRDAGIPAEIYLGNVKKQKHFKYVEDKNIAYLVEIGENEKQSQLFRLRDAKTREMKDNLSLADIINLIK